MIFRQLFDHETFTYTYLLADEKGGDALLIDPVLEKIDDYVRLSNELGVKLTVTMDTHTHADHITAQGQLRELLGCRTMMGAESKSSCASDFFADGDVIKVGKLQLQALHTPGHTNDSYSFYLKDENMLFSGDTLLIRGSGRTDFQQGDAHAQYSSLFNKLLTLPDSTLVYPGHDYKGWLVSSIGEEKRHNPRLQVADADAYKRLMDGLHLPEPKLMDVAVPANQACGQTK